MDSGEGVSMLDNDPTMTRPARTLLNRRSALALLLSATGASLLAACGPAVAPAAPTTAAAPQSGGQPAAGAKPAAAVTSVSAQATTPPQSVKTGGTLRWGQVGDLVTIDAILWSPVSNNTLGQVNEM